MNFSLRPRVAALTMRLTSFRPAEDGGVAIEYGLILALVTLGILLGTDSIGGSVVRYFDHAAAGLQR